MKIGFKSLQKKIKRTKKQMLFITKSDDLTTQEKIDLTTIYVNLIGIYNKKLQIAINTIEVVS